MNFECKSSWVHMSISQQRGARELEKYHSLKYYNVEKWKNKFTLTLNVAKNTHCIKKRFIWILFGIEFRTKKSEIAYVYLPPQSGDYDLVKRRITFTFGLNSAESNELHFKKTSNKSCSELNNFYWKLF